MNSSKLTIAVFVALILGIVLGLVGNLLIHDPATIETIGNWLDLITKVFLRAIMMLIAPLVISTLLSGIAHAAGTGALGRIALRAITWFIGASIVALLIGLIVVKVQAPGVGLHLTAAASSAASGIGPTAPPTFSGFIEHLLPNSIVEAMSGNEVLQIVMFTLVAGAALARLGEKGKPLLDLAESVSHLSLKMAGYVMLSAPIAVFTALAAVLLRRGIGIVGTFAAYVGGIYLALAILWVFLMALGIFALGTRRQWQLMKVIREPALLAFATTSSEAAFPVLLAKLEEFGVPNRIASFILPLGYSFNLVGSMCYGTYAAIFLSQAYDVHMGAAETTQLLLLMFLASKGIANVPRASLLVVAAILPYFQIPLAGVVLILAVDSFVDMGRTCTNTVATAIAAASVAQWEPKETRDVKDSMLA